MAHSTPICDFGWKARDFTLPATDGKTYSLSDIRGPNGTLIMFICNHCPYVLGILDRLNTEMRTVQQMGIGVAAICSNDPDSHPADSFPKMAELAAREGFVFPYLHDADQIVARTYDAACTPDFFGFNGRDELQYRGRLDSAGRNPATPDTKRELVAAMELIASTGEGPREQTPSMGCSIKWRAA